MFATKLISALLLSLLAITAHSHAGHDDHASCGHKHFNEVPQFIDVEEEPLIGQDGRVLSTSSYPGLRIAADYSFLTQGSSAFISYVKNDLMPPVISYFQSALDVKQPLTSALKLPKTITNVCGFTTPNVLFTGVSTDLYVIVSSSSDSANNWVASAGSCMLSSGNYRPIVARMLFNLYYTTPAGDDVMAHEVNTYLTIHEMIHALGFAQSSFPYFIDSSGNLLGNVVKNYSIGGMVRPVLDVEPLTSNLRKYYGCNSVPGAILENDGGDGTYGSHFERRYFLYEVMTSGVINGYRVSTFSFNVLEGSGWYVPDYSYAEPFYFGQGQGCNFISQTCSQAITSFSEFCSVASRGCSPAGRGGGVCSSDSRSDGCYYQYPSLDYDCDNADAASNARFPSWETYGRGQGSKCFTGTLTTATKPTQTSMCYKYTCTGTGLNTVLNVNFGGSMIACKAEGNLSFKGYNGVFNCPDPLTFCNTVGKLYCPRNCMGRGSCVNNKCVCNKGFTGIDCALNA